MNVFKRTDIIKETLNAIKACDGLVFQKSNLNLIKKKYNSKDLYDLAIRYATIGNNTKKLTGRALIKNEIPEIFNGIEETSLLNELDKLPEKLNSMLVKNYPKESGTISIAGKDFKYTYLGTGGSSTAYKLSDDTRHSICFKHANIPTLIPGTNNGIIDEVAILNEANKAGVVDVPKLYMANIFGIKPDSYKKVEGAWQLIEFIDNSKTVKPHGLKLKKWLHSKGLVHLDIEDNPNNMINDFIIDMGMIAPIKASHIDFEIASKAMQGFYEGKTTSEVLQIYQNKHTPYYICKS